MSVSFAELASSPRIKPESRERSYFATGSFDEDEIKFEAESQLPTTDAGFGGRTIDVDPIDHNQGYWEVTATYVKSTPIAPPAEGESEYSFEVATNSVHITQSIETVSVQVQEGDDTHSSFGGVIGVTKDGVDGCDILVPESRFSETHYLSDSIVTEAYRRTLRSIVGKTNDAPFRDHDTGEVLLVGIRGGKRASDEVWQVEFQFATSDNASGLVIGDINPIDKGGFDYLWIYYEPSVEGTRIVPVPAVASVERVYRSANFSDLGIG